MLTAINTDPLAAISEVLISIESDMTFLDREIFAAEDFDTFFAQHNWTDPVVARDLAQSLDILLRRSRASNDAALDEIRRAIEGRDTSA